MRRNIELKQKQRDFLIRKPERGIGYQFVHITLKDGTILRNRIVLYSLYLLLEEGENFSAEDILEIVMKDNIKMAK